MEILYEKLNTKGKISADFYYNKVYAYTSVSQKSLQNIKQFLFEYIPTKINIDFVELIDKNELHYSIGRSLNAYFSEIGINNSLTNVV